MYIARLGTALAGPADMAPGGGCVPDLGVDMCQRIDNPGLGQDNAEWIDYTNFPVSTPDQQRIEAVLEGMDLAGRSILHVGIGNSLLARRFASRCGRIDGITISAPEQRLAESLNITNYRAVVISKYSVSMPAALGCAYDLIIDNNLASFACCGFHLLVMFSGYRTMLRAGGMILTDQQGMNWVVGDPRWRMSFDELARLAQRFALIARRLTETVYALVRES